MNIKKLLFYSILIVIAVAMLIPFIWTLYASFLKNELDANSFSFGPGKFGLSNYVFILTSSHLLGWYKNSIVVTGTITVCNLLFNTMAGYSLARIRVPGRKAIFLLTLGIMMVPVQILFIPIFIMMAHLGWLNTYKALIIPFIVNPFGVFLMRQFYVEFPNELEEAARIDGLSMLRIFYQIALPLAKPALIAQAIFIFVWNWNSFAFPSILIMNPDMNTLPIGIYQITNTAFTSSVTKSMAGVVLMTIPTLLFFMVFQKYFSTNISHTGIKG